MILIRRFSILRRMFWWHVTTPPQIGIPTVPGIFSGETSVQQERFFSNITKYLFWKFRFGPMWLIVSCSSRNPAHPLQDLFTKLIPFHNLWQVGRLANFNKFEEEFISYREVGAGGPGFETLSSFVDIRDQMECYNQIIDFGK